MISEVFSNLNDSRILLCDSSHPLLRQGQKLSPEQGWCSPSFWCPRYGGLTRWSKTTWTPHGHRCEALARLRRVDGCRGHASTTPTTTTTTGGEDPMRLDPLDCVSTLPPGPQPAPPPLTLPTQLPASGRTGTALSFPGLGRSWGYVC